MRIGPSDSSIPIYPAILNIDSYSFSTLSNSASDAELGKRMRLMTNIFRKRQRHSETQESRTNLNIEPVVVHW